MEQPKATQPQKSIKIKEGPRIISLELFILCACLLTLAFWRLNKSGLIQPQRQIRIAFGVSGTLLMFTVFIYSLRKRINGWEKIGTTKTWFRIHMLLGILGPVLIIFHSNFHLGSTNSNVTIFSMLVVALSGIIGRYIYGKVHYDLYGELANLKGLKNKFEQEKEEAGLQFKDIPGIKEELFSFADNITDPSKDLMHSVRRFFIIRWKSHYVYLKARRLSNAYLKKEALAHNWNFFTRARKQARIQSQIRAFIGQAVRVTEFNIYERLFSFWHILHIPLVFILVFALIAHILAVNRY